VIARVVVDVGAITRGFDYSVPDAWSDRVAIGTMVRVPLHGRRIAGWVVDVDVEPIPGLELQPLAKISGVGPSREIVELCRWAAWRWAGRLPHFLRVASPPRAVQALGAGAVRPGRPLAPPGTETLFDQQRSILRLPPAHDPFDIVFAAAARGDALVVCPSIVMASSIVRRLRDMGVAAAGLPDGWARGAAGGCTVVGARAAVFASMPHLAAVLVIDESDEAMQSEGSPTWHAREVALERARRERVPAVMVSATPSLEAMSRTSVRTIDRAAERAGWPTVEVIDRREDDLGRTGLYSSVLVDRLRSSGTTLCVLNRTGRSLLLACRACGTITSCERCESLVVMVGTEQLLCRQCGLERPVICQSCGSTALKNLRVGVSRAREELEALIGEPVVEIAGPDTGEVTGARLMVGTEAILHRVQSASTVAFLEFDQELLAPRYRAAEQALGLIARAGRVVGGRLGRVVIQTREPDHEVLRAALSADPTIVSDADAVRRELLGLPPARTVAVIGGPAGPEFMARFVVPPGVDVDEAGDGQWILRSADRTVLLDSLAATERPGGRLRLQIDPARLRGA